MWVVTKKCSNGSVVWRLVDTDRQTNKQNIYSENLQKTIGRRHYSNTYLMLLQIKSSFTRHLLNH